MQPYPAWCALLAPTPALLVPPLPFIPQISFTQFNFHRILPKSLLQQFPASSCCAWLSFLSSLILFFRYFDRGLYNRAYLLDSYSSSVMGRITKLAHNKETRENAGKARLRHNWLNLA